MAGKEWTLRAWNYIVITAICTTAATFACRQDKTTGSSQTVPSSVPGSQNLVPSFVQGDGVGAPWEGGATTTDDDCYNRAWRGCLANHKDSLLPLWQKLSAVRDAAQKETAKDDAHRTAYRDYTQASLDYRAAALSKGCSSDYDACRRKKDPDYASHNAGSHIGSGEDPTPVITAFPESEATPDPTPSPSPAPSVTPTREPSVKPSTSPSPTPKASPSPKPTLSPSPTPTPVPSHSQTPSPQSSP